MAIFGIKLIFGLMGLRTNGPSDNKADSKTQTPSLGTKWDAPKNAIGGPGWGGGVPNLVFNKIFCAYS